MNWLVERLSKVTDSLDTDPMFYLGWLFLLLGIRTVFDHDIESMLVGIGGIIGGTIFLSKNYQNKEISNQEKFKKLKLIDDEIESDPNNAEVYRKRGYFKMHSLKHYDDAIKDFTMAIQLEPKVSSAYSARGDCEMQQKYFSDALNDYTKAIELDPTNYNPYFCRSKCKNKLGDKVGELEDFVKAKLIIKQSEKKEEDYIYPL